jgi:regulator of protease activity HflC (stomatin/prohibitin superfamily)
LLDQPDDLKLLGCGIPHAWSSPSPIMLLWNGPPHLGGVAYGDVERLGKGVGHDCSDPRHRPWERHGKPVGAPVTTAGLKVKLPFIQDVNPIDKRVLEWDGNPSDMPTKDKLYISVDLFARWRITDPLQYFLRLRDERSAQSRLDDILGSETRNAVAKHELIEIIRTTKDRVPLRDTLLGGVETEQEIGSLVPIQKGRKLVEGEIFAAAAEKVRVFGIELLDIRYYRKCDQASVADALIRSINVEQQKSPKLRSALYTTWGGAQRDLGHSDEALRLGEKAHHLRDDDYRPCTLLGAVHMESGNYNLGKEWYSKAVERGATLDAVDQDLRNIFRRADGAKREEMRRFLISEDPILYKWAETIK